MNATASNQNIMEQGLTATGSDHARVAGIDLLRGSAVTLVVLHHINLRFQLNQYDVKHLFPVAISQMVFWSGYYSVIAFFVISGFLITGLSLKRWATLNQIPIKQFCLLLLLTLLSVLHWAGVADFVIKPERASLARALFAALGFHINWLEGHHGYLPGNWDVLWSLSVEETFYLLFPLVGFLVRSERLLILLFAALIVSGPINRTLLNGKDPWQDYAYLSCTDGLAFGCLAALISARARMSRRVLQVVLALGLTATLLVVVFRTQAARLGLVALGLNVTVLELGIALLLIAFAAGLTSSVLLKGTSLIRGIGRNSYEIYLTHMFVVLGLMQLFKSTQQTVELALLWYAAMFTLSVVLGHWVERYYSRPMNDWLRRKYAGRAEPSLPPATAQASVNEVQHSPRS
jgi:peptidoglycan/LPS O-acetylase OafA/YrhL